MGQSLVRLERSVQCFDMRDQLLDSLRYLLGERLLEVVLRKVVVWVSVLYTRERERACVCVREPYLDHRQNLDKVLDARCYLHNVLEAAQLGLIEARRFPPCSVEDAELSHHVLKNDTTVRHRSLRLKMSSCSWNEPWRIGGHTKRLDHRPYNLHNRCQSINQSIQSR